MKSWAKGLAALGVTAIIIAAFAAASIYAAGGLDAPAGEEVAIADEAAGAAAPEFAASVAAPQLVGGWRVEEQDDSFQDDPRYRVVRLEHRVGGQRLDYVAQFSPWSSDRWTASYSGSVAGAGGPCSVGGGVTPSTWPADADRLRVIRELVAARLTELERDCDMSGGGAASLLDGFDAAFQALAARHARWRADVEAAGPPEAHIG